MFILEAIMKNNHFKIVVLLIILLMSIGYIINIVSYDAPNFIKKGKIDFSDVNLEEEKVVVLNGEWEFYWNEILYPEDFQQETIKEAEYIKVPGPWTQDLNNNKYSGKGVATYRLILNNVPENFYYGLKKQNIRNASRIFVNGEIVLSDGEIYGKTGENISGNISKATYFYVSKPQVEIIIQVANDDFLVGGIAKTIYFGRQANVMDTNHKTIVFELLIAVILFTVGLVLMLFYLTNFRRSREINELLFFSIICISASIVSATLSERVIRYLLDVITLEMIFKLMYFNIYTILSVLVFFCDSLEKNLIPVKLKNGIVIIYGLYIFTIIVAPMAVFLIFSRFFMFFNSLVLGILFILVLRLYLKIKVVGDESLKYLTYPILLLVIFNVTLYNVDLIIYSLGLKRNINAGFIGMLSISLVVTFLLSYRYSKIQSKNQEISMALVESFYQIDQITKTSERNQLAFLQAQIKPHFLFNAMTGIIGLCYNNPKRAGKMLTHLTEYLKYSFQINLDSDHITIEKELYLTKQFVAIEKERFGEKLNISYCVEKEVLSYKIIPLIIEPIVENAIRHGILKNKTGGNIYLNIGVENELLVIEVIDDGIGMDESLIHSIKEKTRREGIGIGLINIGIRLKSFYDSDLMIKSQIGKGTKVSFEIPLTYLKEVKK